MYETLLGGCRDKMVEAESYLNHSVWVVELITLVGYDVLDRYDFATDLCTSEIFPDIFSRNHLNKAKFNYIINQDLFKKKKIIVIIINSYLSII